MIREKMTMKYTRLSHARSRSSVRRKPQLYRKYRQHGIALAIALILLGVLMVFTSLAATLMTSEARLSAAQYNNARTFNAGMASLELMTDRINTLFTSNFNPTAAEIAKAAEAEPIFKDGSTDLFDFTQKVTQLGGNRALVTVKDPPFEGLTARERLFRLEAIAQDARYQTQVRLIRDVANYQIPIFQFAVFGFESLEVAPGPSLYLGGRTHTNRNLFLLNRGSDVRFYGKITAVGEVCNQILQSGQGPAASNGGEGTNGGHHKIYDPSVANVVDIKPSVVEQTGPDNPSVATAYDYNLVDDPASPDGGVKSTNGAEPKGVVVTGIQRLLLPTESQGFQAIEILRRATPTDNLPENEALRNTRFFNGIFARYSTIRILLDDDLEEFPLAIGSEPRAYDLDALANSNDPFWKALDNNVRLFDPMQGNDHPDQPASTVTTGGGAVVPSAKVLPPQTNLINHQPEFQRLATGQVGTTRKRTYIKIELLINDEEPNPPVRLDITPHILNLGITAGPIPVIDNGLNTADLTGTGDDTSPDGKLRASTTYVNTYPLNDTRLTNSLADDDLNDNMLPWLENSAVGATTNPNIGKFKAALGGAFPSSPPIPLRAVGNKTATISYRFEPNAILRLQRTYFPYTPNNGVDMTTANPPTVSDGATAVTPQPIGTGKIGSGATAYPAKFKSLIAKPYFRFTDQFDNNTYVKGTSRYSPALGGNGMMELKSPFGVYFWNDWQRIYKSDALLGNRSDTRFIREISVHVNDCDKPTTNQPADRPGRPNGTVIAVNSGNAANGNLLFSTQAGVNTVAGSTTVSAISVGRDRIFLTLNQLWLSAAQTVVGGAASPSPGAPPTRPYATPSLDSENYDWLDLMSDDTKLRIRQVMAKYIREQVFKPGIPGFYALNWGTDPASQTAQNGDGRDGRVDLDVNWDADPANFSASDPRTGVIDLNEMTAFPNVDPNSGQVLLNRIRTAVETLTEADFNHLGWADTAAIASPTAYNMVTNVNGRSLPSYLMTSPTNTTYDSIKYSFIDGLRDVLKNIEPGMTAPAVAEFPKENLVFDWNGDGIIESPHYPFQGGTTPKDTVITQGLAVGYSVESNICSLVPSTLSVSPQPQKTSAVTVPSNTPVPYDRSISRPVEIRLVERDGFISFPQGGTDVGAVLKAKLESYRDMGSGFDPLEAMKNYRNYSNGGRGISFSGQADPDPGASTAKGFENNVSSFKIEVPLGTLGMYRTVTKGGTNPYSITVRARSAIRIIFQHPLAPRGVALTAPSNLGFSQTVINQTGNPTQIGRNLGLTDVHYSYPGHCYLDFVPNATNENQPASATPVWLPRVRTQTDTAFPINTYDLREGRHVSRNVSFQGTPSVADYYDETIGTGAGQIIDNQWPNWPSVADDERIVYNLGQQLPMPSPVSLERRGMMNIVELDMGNLKKLFRGDYDDYLSGFGNDFKSGQPRLTPKGDTTNWGGDGIIDISDNGLMVYISDRRGDDNNDGIYEFNDVFGENEALDTLDDTVNTITDPGSNQKGKPGDGELRRDVDVETQPTTAPTDNSPARTGEAPHGSVPVNDGFEYFNGRIKTKTRRMTNPEAPHPTPVEYISLRNGQGLNETMFGVSATIGGTPAATSTGAKYWRMVDSAKTGRIRAFRRAVRIVNGWDIPRWYLPQDGPVPRHFTGMSLVTENPVYIYGNLNAIGVGEYKSTAPDPDSGIPTNGPTSSRRFLQTGNKNIGRVPTDFYQTPAVTGGADDALLHGPMAIMSDAVLIQSRGFSDARMFLCPRGTIWRSQSLVQRVPMETTVKAAWLTGQPKAGVQDTSVQCIDNNDDALEFVSGDSPNTQGGVHNFPRFCEGWGSIQFNYNGSFIHQFYSHQANGPWQIRGPKNSNNDNVYSNYGAPPRNWNFDQAFRKLGGLPPGTPRVSFYKIRGFRQVFIEDQD